MGDPAEYALVVKAYRLSWGPRGHVSGYVLWSEKGLKKSQRDLAQIGLTAEGVRRKAIEFVSGGGQIDQRAGDPIEHPDFPFCYRIVFPHEGLPRGVFVESILVDDDDPESPIVNIVSAHEQRV